MEEKTFGNSLVVIKKFNKFFLFTFSWLDWKASQKYYLTNF